MDDKYSKVAAFLPFRNFFQTSNSQEAAKPTEKLGKGSGNSSFSRIFRFLSTAPFLVNSPTFSNSEPAYIFTKGKYSPFLIPISFFALFICCEIIFNSWLFTKAVSIKATKLASEKKFFQLIFAEFKESEILLLKFLGTILFSFLINCCEGTQE